MVRSRAILHSGRAAPPRGFTLCELLVVLVVLGIMALVTIPQSDGFADQKIVNAAKLLIADLEYTQMRSLGNGVDPCVLVFDSTKTTYWIARQSDPSTPITHPVTQEPYQRALGADAATLIGGIYLDHTDAVSNGRVLFSAFGCLQQATDALIVLRSSAATISITVDASTGECWVNPE